VKLKTPIVEGVDWEAEIRNPAGNTFGLFESVNQHWTRQCWRSVPTTA
jgi:hypothetical protein